MWFCSECELTLERQKNPGTGLHEQYGFLVYVTRKLWQTITNHCQYDYPATLTLFEGFSALQRKRLSKCLCFSWRETYSWACSMSLDSNQGVPWATPEKCFYPCMLLNGLAQDTIPTGMIFCTSSVEMHGSCTIASSFLKSGNLKRKNRKPNPMRNAWKRHVCFSYRR